MPTSLLAGIILSGIGIAFMIVHFSRASANVSRKRAVGGIEQSGQHAKDSQIYNEISAIVEGTGERHCFSQAPNSPLSGNRLNRPPASRGALLL